MSLSREHCTPCEGGTPPLESAEAERLGKETPAWRIGGKHIHREWTMPDFTAVLAAVNKIGAIAEKEGHHPDMHITNYRQLRVDLSTHAIGGLSVNDFILAAKIDEALEDQDSG